MMKFYFKKKTRRLVFLLGFYGSFSTSRKMSVLHKMQTGGSEADQSHALTAFYPREESPWDRSAVRSRDGMPVTLSDVEAAVGQNAFSD